METNRPIDFLSAAEDFKNVGRSVNKRRNKAYAKKFLELRQKFVQVVSNDLGLAEGLSLDELTRNKKAQNHFLSKESLALYNEFDDLELRNGIDPTPTDEVDYEPAADAVISEPGLAKEELEEQAELKKYLENKKDDRHPLY